MSGSPLAVLVAGPSRLVRSVLREELVAAAGEAVSVTEADRADDVLAGCASGARLLVSDVRVGDASLLPVLPAVLGHGTRVLVVCARAETGDVPPLLLAGTSGVLLLEECDGAALWAAARETVQGGATLHPDVANLVLEQWRAVRPVPPALTVKEHEVLTAMLTGEPVKTIARSLGLSARTVDSHRSRIFVKLGVRSHAQAVQRALDLGLVR